MEGGGAQTGREGVDSHSTCHTPHGRVGTRSTPLHVFFSAFLRAGETLVRLRDVELRDVLGVRKMGERVRLLRERDGLVA